MRRTALRFLSWKRKSKDANGKLRRTSARETEETWLFDNGIWMTRGRFARSLLRLILRSIAKQCVSKDGAALVLRDAAFGRSSG